MLLYDEYSLEGRPPLEEEAAGLYEESLRGEATAEGVADEEAEPLSLNCRISNWACMEPAARHGRGVR